MRAAHYVDPLEVAAGRESDQPDVVEDQALSRRVGEIYRSDFFGQPGRCQRVMNWLPAPLM